MNIEPNRRDLLNWGVQGTGATAFASLLNADKASGSSVLPHYPGVAKRVIHICLVGGMSHIDSFDHKPELQKVMVNRPSLAKNLTFFLGGLVH